MQYMLLLILDVDAKPDEHEDTGKNLMFKNLKLVFHLCSIPKYFSNLKQNLWDFRRFCRKKSPYIIQSSEPPLPPQGVDQALLESQLG